MSSTVTPEPDEAQHRLAVAEGLLSSIDGVRSQKKARELLGLSESAPLDEVVAGLTDVVEASHAAIRAAGVDMGPGGDDDDDDAASATGEKIPVQGHDPPSDSYLYVPVTMTEATVVDGQQTPYGGATDPEELDDAVGPQVPVMTRPPNLREATGWERCGSCIFFNKGCTKYGAGRPGGKPDLLHVGQFPVREWNLCDSFETVSPPEARGQESQVYKDRQLVMEARIRDVLGLSEIKSSAYPDLDRSPRSNWVENTGGLPNYIERIAKHVHYEHGKDISRAIQIAVGVVRRWCHGGSVSARGEARKGGLEKPTSGVSAKTRAKACAALAEWDAKRAASKAKTAAKSTAERAKRVSEAISLVEADGFHLLTVDDAQALIEAAEWEQAGDGSVGFKEPSLAYCERIVNAVEEAYSDWDEWPGGFSPQAMREIREGTLDLNGATCGALGLDSSLVEGVFDPVKHPRRRSGEFTDVLGKLAVTRPRTADVLGRIGRNARGRSKPIPTVQMPARVAIDRQISQQGTEHGHEFPSSLRELFPAATPVGLAPLHFKAAMAGAGQHDFSVDKAIGDVVSKFPNVKDWDLDGPKSDSKGQHWVVHVTTHGGEEHHIRVGADGSVGLVDPPATKSAPTGHLYSMSELEPTGTQEKPYHMADHTLFHGEDGKVYEKLEHGPHLMTSKKGTPLAAVRILDHSTGTSKLAPAFAVSHYYDVLKPKGQAHAAIGGKFKTAAQEKAEAFEASLARPFKGTHTFQPGVMDIASPTVVRGSRIEPGSEVRIVRGGRGQEKLDPLGKLVWVQDKAGNVQSVWKAGLVPKRKKKLTEEVAPMTRRRLDETLELLETATSGEEITRLRARRDVLASQLARQIEERDFSEARRKQLAAEGKALPNGSYPIENEEDLHNAASLAASGHGDAAAAKALIAKRAAALGVENPLKKRAKKAA